jgi:hypothetical protein
MAVLVVEEMVGQEAVAQVRMGKQNQVVLLEMVAQEQILTTR